MAQHFADPTTFERPPDWSKDRKLRKKGFRDLEYLPKERSGWNCTLAAHAFSARRQLTGPPDLNLWAAMHALPPRGRYEQLGDDALVDRIFEIVKAQRDS